MQFITLASSSKGNCYYIGSASGGILIDCGISTRRIVQGLAGVPGALENLKGVFVTHEHSDHIKGLRVFLKRFPVPCFGSPGTIAAMREMEELHSSIGDLLTPLQGDGLRLGEMEIAWRSASHDAADPLGYRIRQFGKQIGVLTDTGVLTEDHKAFLYDSDLLFMEANHDPELLKYSRYPAFLKKRIRSPYGHLSNAACAAGLNEILTGRTRHVVLGHLSEENNRPEIAFNTIRSALSTPGRVGQSLGLWVADPARTVHLSL